MDDMSKIARSDGIRLHTTLFFWLFGFRVSDAQHCSLLPSCIMRHVFSSMVKLVKENGMEGAIRELLMLVRVLVAMRFWLVDS
jgi:hypothetical protein